MARSYIRHLDPVQGLVDYVQDTKPYHTKIIEVMLEYVFNDNLGVNMIENDNYLKVSGAAGWDSFDSSFALNTSTGPVVVPSATSPDVFARGWDTGGWDDDLGSTTQIR